MLIASSLSLGLAAASLQARPVPQNLAGGLGALVESDIAVKAKPNSAQFNGYATQQAADYASKAIQDTDTGRFLVDIYPTNNRVNAEKLVPMLQERFASFTLTALDTKYHGVGVVEGFIALDDVPALGNMHEVRSVSLGLKPELNRPVRPGGGIQLGTTVEILGTVTDQGVFQHRVDQINKFYNPNATIDLEGSGTSIGFISDSIGNTTTDVNNFDLPGASTIRSIPSRSSFCRTSPAPMKAAPWVKSFIRWRRKRALVSPLPTGAKSISPTISAHSRRLPGFEYPPEIQKGFKADVICDDVGYSDEPFFEDGLIADAVDDVAAAGVSYFSSAGNDIGTYDYDSDYRNVPNGPGALDGTNINLTGVPTNLYQGGFHNFNPNPGQQDVAQTVNVPASGEPATNFQWDDPFNQVLNFDPNPIFTAMAVYTNMPLTFLTPSSDGGPELCHHSYGRRG